MIIRAKYKVYTNDMFYNLHINIKYKIPNLKKWNVISHRFEYYFPDWFPDRFPDVKNMDFLVIWRNVKEIVDSVGMDEIIKMEIKKDLKDINYTNETESIQNYLTTEGWKTIEILIEE